VLIVDSVFAFRPEYNDLWDYRIWLEVPPDVSLQRGVDRDTAAEGLEEAARVHRDRYHGAERIYLAGLPSPVSRRRKPAAARRRRA
jgi:uridine kinase